MYVQFGCGHTAPDGWVNFDSSPTLRIERLPLIGGIIRKNAKRFPANVRYGDIVKGLPIPDGAVRGLYGSHVLEHLSRDDMQSAVQNCFRSLIPGGIFRLVVPDLETRAREYLALVESGSAKASDHFMHSTSLGRKQTPKGVLEGVTKTFGNSSHLWMWDFPSMADQLRMAGFVSIRRCSFNDSEDSMFSRVEDIDRFNYGRYPELAIEAKRS